MDPSKLSCVNPAWRDRWLGKRTPIITNRGLLLKVIANWFWLFFYVFQLASWSTLYRGSADIQE